jgi:hypothetical protein
MVSMLMVVGASEDSDVANTPHLTMKTITILMEDMVDEMSGTNRIIKG